jgi:hypothetical protein
VDLGQPGRRERARSKVFFGASALAGAVILFGCRAREAPPRPGPDGGSGVSSGLRVPLPQGWIAQAPSSDVLVLGPPGRPVLRIERTRAEALPGLEHLQSGFTKELRNVHARTLEEREDDGGVLWRARLESSERPAGGRGVAVMLGARRIDGSVVLCSTLPGSTDAEVEAASQACGALGP